MVYDRTDSTGIVVQLDRKNLFAASAILLVAFVAGCESSGRHDSVSISAQKSSDLISWLTWAQAPEAVKREHPGLPFEICDELLLRGDVDFLLGALETMSDDEARTKLVSRVLYELDDERINRAFSARLDDKPTEEKYYVANYLAKRGDMTALATLNHNWFSYPISSWQWSYTVALFGECKYEPATTNLVRSLDAASGNVVAAAIQSLQVIYPDSPPHFERSDDAKVYFVNRMNEVRAYRAR